MKTKLFFILTFIVSAIICQHIKAQALYVPGGTGGIGNNIANGNVGIGTSSPRANLDVANYSVNTLKTVLARLGEGDNYGEGTYLGVRAYDTHGTYHYGGINSFSIEHKFYDNINSSINFYRGGDVMGGFITFSTNNNSERMRISSSGNVGIGTSNPLNKLDVNGTIGLFGDGLDGSVYQRSVIYSDATYGLYFDAPLKADGTGLPINFGWRGGSSKITFLPIGNILIGRTTQTNSSYKLDVAGKIRADEIVVNTTGADFVFEPGYKLRTLSELETFIRSNKHLPDIAPAKEMQENGVSAGEMQAKLLQKVEELTLYVIEKDKQINNQNQIISQQQQLLMELKQEIEKLKQN